MNIDIGEGTTSCSVEMFSQGVWPCVFMNGVLVIRNYLEGVTLLPYPPSLDLGAAAFLLYNVTGLSQPEVVIYH